MLDPESASKSAIEPEGMLKLTSVAESEKGLAHPRLELKESEMPTTEVKKLKVLQELLQYLINVFVDFVGHVVEREL